MKFDYELFEDEETIEISNFDKDDASKTIRVDLIRFWDWVDAKGFNQWCNDFHDPREYDGHGQETGKFNMEQYFGELDNDSIRTDLSIYLRTELGININ
jgi:hypothetical protein